MLASLDLEKLSGASFGKHRSAQTDARALNYFNDCPMLQHNDDIRVRRGDIPRNSLSMNLRTPSTTGGAGPTPVGDKSSLLAAAGFEFLLLGAANFDWADVLSVPSFLKTLGEVA